MQITYQGLCVADKENFTRFDLSADETGEK